MDKKSLEKNLDNLERELLALQTAHDIGLGVVRYYEYSGTSSGAKLYILLDIEVAQGERAFPFMNILIERQSGGRIQYNAVWQEGSDGMKFAAQCGGLGQVIIDWKIISTSKLIISER